MTTGRDKTAADLTQSPPLCDLEFRGDRLTLTFADDRSLSLPLRLYPTLERASNDQRSDWHLIGPNRGIHWPQLDLDLSIEGLLHGLPERIPQPPQRA